MSYLDGIRVLDFGRYIAGPYCATLLGYLGAEVIRLERPGGGEDRYMVPVTSGSEGALFMQTAANKKGMTLRSTTPEGGEILRRLITTADVVVANLPAAPLKRMGLDYESLYAIKPDIILTTVSAFGSSGPYAARKGFDGVAQAMSGAMHLTGTPGKPVKAAAAYVDYATATMAALGTVCAIMERTKSGKGQHVEASLLGTSLALFGAYLVEESATGIDREGTGNRSQTSGPSDVFTTKDGQILIHCVGDGIFKRWAELMGEDCWLNDERFASDQLRGDNGAVISERMASWCAERTTDEALEDLERADIPAGPVISTQDALKVPQLAALNMFSSFAYPGLREGTQVPGLPVELAGTGTGIRSRPPTLGEHSDLILSELGYSRAEIDGFRKRNII